MGLDGGHVLAVAVPVVGTMCLSLTTSGWVVSVVLYLVGAAASVVLGASLWLAVRLCTSTEFQPKSRMSKLGPEFHRQVVEAWIGRRRAESVTPGTGGTTAARSPAKAPTISRNIDQELNEIIDNLYRDYVDYWLRGLREPRDRSVYLALLRQAFVPVRR